jgi:sigma-B regulation protein RsbU (phosphoserine phosphatase)
MLAKENIAAREDESSPYLRGRTQSYGEMRPLPAEPSPSNVVALRRGDGSMETIEARLREAFGKTLLEPLSLAKAITASMRHEMDEAHTEPLKTVADALGRADDRLREMLDFMVSSSAGGLRIVPRRLDLKVLCERVIDTIQRDHPEHAIVFACESRVDGQWDPDRIASLLFRLVMNAIQHGVAGRVIRVALEARAEHVVLEVHNQGSPLGDDIMRRLFEPFAGARATGAAHGLGLGLYLSREIVRAHGGRIEVRTDRDETCFCVILPRRQP